MQQHFTFMIDESSEFDWRIDDHTRQVGLMGIASARQTLASCPQRPEPQTAVAA